MDTLFSPLLKQLLVAGSPLFAAFSVGGVVSYPSVLLSQLKANDSSIYLDLHTGSWIGSIHGLAGIPSILMPVIMQWRGRKLAYITTCITIMMGWILIYIATDVTTLLVAESFHGIGANSLLFVSFSSISEMVAPKLRNVSLISYCVVQALGIAVVNIIGGYLLWKTVCLVMIVPVVAALLIACLWPESPPWLACKGKFEQSQKAFVSLRGNDEDSNKEFGALIAAQRVILQGCKNKKRNNMIKGFWLKISSRDFYLPSLHMFVVLNMIYWSGMSVILIYASQLIEKATSSENAAFVGGIVISLIYFVCNSIATVTTKYFNNKSVLLLCTGGIAVCLLCACVISYMQSIGTLPKDSLTCFYCLIAYMVFGSSGLVSIGFALSSELMPVKHRGLGGALYTIFLCVLHTSSLKTAPYLFLYIDLWGTFLLYMLNAILCSLYVWKYVPETKGKTLQEIEDYYVHGQYNQRVMEMDSVLNPIVKIVD